MFCASISFESGKERQLARETYPSQKKTNTIEVANFGTTGPPNSAPMECLRNINNKRASNATTQKVTTQNPKLSALTTKAAPLRAWISVISLYLSTQSGKRSWNIQYIAATV